MRLLPAGLAPTLRRGRYVIPEVEALEYNQTQQTGVDYVFGTRGLEPVREDEVTLQQYAVLGACGAVCTAAAHVALTPLELVKTKLQTSAATSAVDVTKEIYEEDGLLALFAGWEPIIVRIFHQWFFRVRFDGVPEENCRSSARVGPGLGRNSRRKFGCGGRRCRCCDTV